MLNNIVQKGAIIIAAIVIVIFLVFIVKDIVEIIKGSGSILKTLGKVAFVFLMIGVIFAATQYKTIGDSFNNVAQNAIKGVAGEADNLFK